MLGEIRIINKKRNLNLSNNSGIILFNVTLSELVYEEESSLPSSLFTPTNTHWPLCTRTVLENEKMKNC